ncbi:MAG: hypothetical protein LBU32_06475 [Clostridiales bacterium]|jgi:hypothetical protein|nr:hypothetical protein [Clostridiales bacterium]
MKQFAANNLGVSAFKNGDAAGFLRSYPPIHRQLEKVLGAYSPKCSNAADGQKRASECAQMHQATQGLSNHAIALDAHNQFQVP